MGPLARVGALGEKPAELVDARRVGAQDPVRVLVDERNRAQYFRKWPCCSKPRRPASRPSHSERRTARYELGGSGPSAACRTSSPASASSASRWVAGAGDAALLALSLGDRRRVDLDRLGRLELALRPSSPAAISPPSARYGLQLASQAFSSRLVDDSSRAPERGRHAHRRLAVVVAPAGERASPELRHEPVVGVEARHGEPAQPRQVVEDAGHERRANGERLSGAPASWNRLRLPCQSEKWTGVPLPACRATASARARRQALAAATPRIVSRTSTCWSAAGSAGAARSRSPAGRGRARRSTARAGSAARRARPPGRRCSPARRSSRSSRSRAPVDGTNVVVPSGQRELVLERRLQHGPALGEPRGHAAQEAARAARPRARRRGRSGRTACAPSRGRTGARGRCRVGHEPHLADRPEAVDGLQLVERVHGLHADRDPDPAAIRPSSGRRADALPRTVPSFPQQRKRTSGGPPRPSCESRR